MKTAVQFGAGNIGRGFTGQLFSESGYEVVFVDVIPEVVDALNREGQYTIRIASDNPEEIVVRNVRAVNGRDMDAVAREVAGCDIACTAVGVNVLGTIAKPIRTGLEARQSERPDEPLNIIICENMRDAAGALREMVLNGASQEFRSWVGRNVGFSQAVVGRMVPVRTAEERAADLLGIRVEAYCRLPIDAEALRGQLDPIKGVLPRGNFQAYIDQKLFAHNAGHAASAYLGALRGLRYVWECMEDEWVRSRVEGVMRETGEALISRYGLSPDEHWEHVQDLLRRFGNRALGDTVDRVGGDPLRKLGRDDRLVGAALFCMEEGVEPKHVAEAIAAGLRFRNQGDPTAVKMHEMILHKGVQAAFSEICGEPAESELGRMVLAAYEALA